MTQEELEKESLRRAQAETLTLIKRWYKTSNLEDFLEKVAETNNPGDKRVSNIIIERINDYLGKEYFFTQKLSHMKEVSGQNREHKRKWIENGDTVLHVAARTGNTEVLKMYLGVLERYLEAFKGECFFNVDGLSKEAKDEAKKILNAQNKNGDTVLHVAARIGNTKVLKVFLEELELKMSKDEVKRILNVQNKNGDTPLHIAVKDLKTAIDNNKPLEEVSGKLVLIDKLIKQGADYKIRNHDGVLSKENNINGLRDLHGKTARGLLRDLADKAKDTGVKAKINNILEDLENKKHSLDANEVHIHHKPREIFKAVRGYVRSVGERINKNVRHKVYNRMEF